MRTQIIIFFITFVIGCQSMFGTAPAMAQNKQGTIYVKSTPPGAMVQFEGASTYVGVAPFKLRAGLHGNYKIYAFKSGYEKRKYEYFFAGTENGLLKIRLNPKTRFKAFVRSMVFTGWGQIYSERKTYGLFLNLLQIGSIVGSVLALNDYHQAVDEYDQAVDQYQANMQFYHLRNEYWVQVVRKHQRADDLYEKSRIWLWASAGIWLYNVLDSLFFFPSFDKEMFDRSLPAVSAGYRDGTSTVTLSIPLNNL
ncbi:hypothetical protein GF337_16270 [candidate division KSB1 bacterium]|nr:hypothetical protein [candidate division KSB1 bacterium]